ncbi:MAG: efflux transporter outer membrane subunit [Candidatus Levyibacteriota bacterium]
MRRSSALRRWVGTVVGGAILAGCTTVGPDYKAPAAPSVEGYTRGKLPAATAAAPAALGEAQHLASGQPVPPDWWRQFESPKLDDLVAQALAHSPTLAAAEATLRQAQQTYAAQAGSTLYPTVDARLGASRNEAGARSTSQRNGTHSLYSLYNVGIAVNYNLDLFGGNRRFLESLAAAADYQGFQLAAARLALAGNVVTAAFSQAQFAAQVEATEAIVKAQQDQLDIARKRFELGASARSEVLTLETQLEQNRASLPLFVNRMQQADHLLAVLIGQAPGAVDIPRFALSDFKLPQSVPVVVPSELVRGRPDIQASAALLHAATARYGVAVANLYPQINLSGALATQALTAGSLFGPGTLVWALAGQLAQPLFDAGLKSAASAAEANLQAAGANYEETVLLALRSVADALRALESDAQALQAQAAADAAAQESLALVQQQYDLGAASYLQLLISQQQARQARVLLILAQAQRLADTAALYQAMGGGTLAGAGADRTAKTE